MTLSVIAANSIGTGVRFTFASPGDELIILNDVTVASTNDVAINFGSHQNTVTVINGTLISAGLLAMAGDGGYLEIGESGALISTSPLFSQAVWLGGSGCQLVNHGRLSATDALAVILNGGDLLVNTGTISGSTGILMGVNGADNTLFNSGTITASLKAVTGSSAPEIFNNAISVDGTQARIFNLETGIISAFYATGSGIHAGRASGSYSVDGLLIKNMGEITSTNWFGIDLIHALSGDLTRTINLGTISGDNGSYRGYTGTAELINRGIMDGDVYMLAGNDVFDNRTGLVSGDWFGGGGDDFYNGRLDTKVSGQIDGGAGNDVIYGGDNRDEIVTGSGNDEVRSYAGDDLINVDAGSNLIVTGDGADQVNGGLGADNVFGGRGDDTLFGKAGDDILRGDLDDDLIEGGLGVDLMFGGQGRDTFVFRSPAEIGTASGARDRIIDFVSGEDVIQLSAIDANETVGGNQVFDFIGSAAFTGAGQLRYTSNGLLQGNVDGDSAAEFIIQLASGTVVLESDLLL